MRKLLKEMLTGGFFSQYNQMYNERFVALLGELSDDDIETLDWALLCKTGDRILTTNYAMIDDDEGLTKLVRTCNALFYDSWVRIMDIVKDTDTIDVLNPITETRSTTETNQLQDSDTTQEQTNGFDDVENAVDTNSTSRSGSSERNVERTVDIKRSGVSAIDNSRSGIDFARHNNALDMIMSDIASVCTIDIF